ncbi:guanine-1-methyltransferase-domain-containing protein [Dipodascopsis tothii]|uniref:guanine-1-methyltransferase-domain-containing protein n=1 Tax=Dipodascopsis tothii TaxID=44089 RepID=UPI0034CF316D
MADSAQITAPAAAAETAAAVATGAGAPVAPAAAAPAADAPAAASPTAAASADSPIPRKPRPPPPDGMSRNAWKREERKRKWLEGKDERNQQRKQKRKQKRADKREAGDSDDERQPNDERKRPRLDATREPAPITFLLDCGFDELMTEKERISLSAQVTRCYSENRRAAVPARLAVSSLNGQLLERFEGALKGQYKQWKGVAISSEDYVVPEADRANWVYLSSDSDNTLETLDDNKTYVVGGIVDKGRYKNLCRDKAEKQQIATARLPISDYIKISGRKVLTTNHVVEIMLKWLEVRDWKAAFEAAIPARKQEGFESARTRRRQRPDDSDSAAFEDAVESL